MQCSRPEYVKNSQDLNNKKVRKKWAKCRCFTKAPRQRASGQRKGHWMLLLTKKHELQPQGELLLAIRDTSARAKHWRVWGLDLTQHP
jgi:hypothetical protein